jgi:hypothetical protein
VKHLWVTARSVIRCRICGSFLSSPDGGPESAHHDSGAPVSVEECKGPPGGLRFTSIATTANVLHGLDENGNVWVRSYRKDDPRTWAWVLIPKDILE